MIDPKI